MVRLGIFAVILIAALPVSSAGEAGQPAPPAHLQAERTMVTELCSGVLPQERARRLAASRFETADGLVCAERILEILKLDTLRGRTGALLSSELLWSIVQTAIMDEDQRAPAAAILEEIADAGDHPLRSEAWLGIQTIALSDGRIKNPPDYKPAITPPSEHLLALLPVTEMDTKEYAAQFTSFHPLHRKHLGWLYAQRVRALVSAPMPDVAPGIERERLAEIAWTLFWTAKLPTDFSHAVVEDAMGSLLLLAPAAAHPLSGTDVLTPMEFTVDATACAAGDFVHDYCIRLKSLYRSTEREGGSKIRGTAGRDHTDSEGGYT